MSRHVTRPHCQPSSATRLLPTPGSCLAPGLKIEYALSSPAFRVPRLVRMSASIVPSTYSGPTEKCAATGAPANHSAVPMSCGQQNKVEHPRLVEQFAGFWLHGRAVRLTMLGRSSQTRSCMNRSGTLWRRSHCAAARSSHEAPGLSL
jgi:hypothetical protein